MKAKPLKREKDYYRKCHSANATHVQLSFPGPSGNIILPVNQKPGVTSWKWNLDINNPTLTPSVKTQFDKAGKSICHSFIEKGQVYFLADSTHELAGKTVDLLEVE